MNAPTHNRPIVSAIVPIYNVERFLDQCLQSIMDQSLESLEVICINDGSTDGSLNIINKFAAQDARFIVVDKENEGYGASCNRGLDMAQGTYIAIIEPDDYILPDMFKDMVDFASTFTVPVDIIKTPWFDVKNWNFKESERITPGYLYRRIETSRDTFTLDAHPVLIETHPSIWSALYRREFLDFEQIRFHPYPGAGWADNPFLIETMIRAKNIVYLDKPYYFYRNDLTQSLVRKTEEPDMLPIDRWIEMCDVLDDLEVVDPRILASHYIRGVNYLEILLEKYDHERVLGHAKTKQMLERIDTDIFLDIGKVSPSRKKVIFDAMEKPMPQISPGPYRRYLKHELAHRLRTEGIVDTIKSIRNRA